MTAPVLPDGLVAFVKKDCATCVMVEPVLRELEDAGRLVRVYTQDDPAFPDSDVRVDDSELDASWHYDIETVPTLVHVEGGKETGRVVGWVTSQWAEISGLENLAAGIDLPDYRPGCGSMSVDPDLVASLEARYGTGFASRTVEFASAEDEIEAMYDRGWSDGLPLVPPTPERVAQMLAGTSRDRHDVIAVVPPNLVDCTVEKVAINAVMAGCRPEYLPVVLTAVEAACTDEFNMHGLLCTTMPVGPVLFVNGPISNAIGMNSGLNVLGQGNRANSTIGRALQLVVRNVGGGEPGGIDRATHGSPAKLGFCFAEDEEGSPWESYAESKGFSADQSTVTLFPGESPRCAFDQLSRDPDDLARSLAKCLEGTIHPKFALMYDAILVIGPEHSSRFADAGWSKQDLHDKLIEYGTRDADTLLRGAQGIAEGLPPVHSGRMVPKHRPKGGLLIVHAGGGAGLFSAIIGGWVNGDLGSKPVTREITP